jgi:hypothetical protein
LSSENESACVTSYLHGIISVWIISIPEIVGKMVADKITLKQRVNSKTVLGIFVVCTWKYDHFEYDLNKQQTIQYLFRL